MENKEAKKILASKFNTTADNLELTAHCRVSSALNAMIEYGELCTHHSNASFVALVEYTDKLEGLLLNLRHHAGLSDSNIEWIDRVFNENPTN